MRISLIFGVFLIVRIILGISMEEDCLDSCRKNDKMTRCVSNDSARILYCGELLSRTKRQGPEIEQNYQSYQDLGGSTEREVHPPDLERVTSFQNTETDDTTLSPIPFDDTTRSSTDTTTRSSTTTTSSTSTTKIFTTRLPTPTTTTRSSTTTASSTTNKNLSKSDEKIVNHTNERKNKKEEEIEISPIKCAGYAHEVYEMEVELDAKLQSYIDLKAEQKILKKMKNACDMNYNGQKQNQKFKSILEDNSLDRNTRLRFESVMPGVMESKSLTNSGKKMETGGGGFFLLIIFIIF